MNFSSTNFKRTFRLLLWKNGRKELEKNKIEVQKRVSERNRAKNVHIGMEAKDGGR